MHRFLAGKRVEVLCGGPSAEREVSLRSGAAVSKALRTLDADVNLLDVPDTEIQLPDRVDVVFNALHGTFGEDGGVQAILDQLGVSYTGEGEMGCRLAFDKIASKLRFTDYGVPTAPYVTLRLGEERRFRLPAVVKVPCQGSSVGIYIVKTEPEADAALAKAFLQTDTVLVEAFVAGRGEHHPRHDRNQSLAGSSRCGRHLDAQTLPANC